MILPEHNRIHSAALKISDKGKPPFPCKPEDKSPYTPRGFKDASTDPAKITAWWKKHPDALIGMPTGERSGVFVLDEDRQGAIEELPHELPETLVVRTRSGGRHFYFSHVEGLTNRTGSLPDGIDVRAEGGYVIVPPSPGYTIEHRAPIADAPEWLLDILREQPARTPRARRPRPEAVASVDGGPIPEGSRNQTLARIAGRLHDGTRELAQLDDDLQAVNEARCTPPLPPEQVRRIARSIHRYEPCRRARREPDPSTVAALAKIEREILGREYKGKGGKTRYSIAVAALRLARRHSTLVEDGVRLEVSARQLALEAATSRSSIMRHLKEMGDILRPDNENVEPGKSGAIVLLLPPARTDTTLPTDLGIEGGCVNSRAPLTAPRLRWSSPARKQKRGVTPGTSKVRDSIITKKRDVVVRLGKSCERVMDALEAAGGSLTLAALAEEIDVRRPRDLTRRKNQETGKGRDGFVTRLENVGVLEVNGGTVTLAEDWLEALNEERERAGEVEQYRQDMRRYNREREAYRNREKVKADRAPSQEEMQEVRESFPERRREAIKIAVARLFQEYPEYRVRRAGQITCRLPFYLPEDFPRGSLGAPKDAEVEAILEGVAA